MIADGQTIWFVHLGYEPPLPLQFERVGYGARVVGGKSGSHRTGHGETYWDKFVEVINLGFIPVELGKDLNLIPKNWLSPNIENLDEAVRRGDFKLK